VQTDSNLTVVDYAQRLVKQKPSIQVFEVVFILITHGFPLVNMTSLTCLYNARFVQFC